MRKACVLTTTARLQTLAVGDVAGTPERPKPDNQARDERVKILTNTVKFAKTVSTLPSAINRRPFFASVCGTIFA